MYGGVSQAEEQITKMLKRRFGQNLLDKEQHGTNSGLQAGVSPCDH